MHVKEIVGLIEISPLFNRSSMKKVLKNIIIGILVIGLAVVVTFILRGIFFSFDKKLSAKTKREIEAYIQNLDVPKYDNSMTFLSTYYFGDRFNDDKLEVYVWVLYEEYTDNSGELKLEQSSSIPYLINIDTSSNEYKIIGYETPRDGNEYKKSIDKMFPITIRNRILMFQKSNEYKKMHQEHQKLIDIYKEYNEGE